MITSLPPYVVLTPDQKRALTELVFGPPSRPAPADVCFVFGGTHPGLWQTAIALFRDGYVGRFIVTGGTGFPGRRHPDWTYGPDTPESHGIADRLIRAGVPRESIVIEDRSTNSFENVRFAAELVDLSVFRSILVVTKSYATGRQIRTLRGCLPAETIVHSVSFATDAYAVGAGCIDRDNWTDTVPRVRLVLGAYQRIIRYGSLGHLVPAEPIPGVPLL